MRSHLNSKDGNRSRSFWQEGNLRGDVCHVRLLRRPSGWDTLILHFMKAVYEKPSAVSTIRRSVPMLRFLREKGNTWLLKGLLGFVALTFVSWGGYSMTSQQAVPGGRVAAWVNETPITIREFENRYFQQTESMRRRLGVAFTPDLEKQLNLRRATFQLIVLEKLQFEEAARLGIEISDGEVALNIQEESSFQSAGRFDKSRFL